MKKILVTGASGMVGTSIRKMIDEKRFIFISSKEVDLSRQLETEKFIKSMSKEIDGVIHLAANVGGSQINKMKPEDFFSTNLKINLNLLNSCVNNEIKKVISILSTCIYPEAGPFPLKEELLHYGEPHPTTLGYSYSKRMLEVHSRAIIKQHKYDYKCLIPNNLYGPNDNFHLSDSHVIPSIIRKIYEASKNKTECILLGDGSPIREFTFSDDFAKIILLFYNDPKYNIMNVGNPMSYKISEVAQIICAELNYDYSKIIWEGKRSNEQQQKICNYEKQSCYKTEYTSLQEGIRQTINWFTKSYPNIRGI